MRLALDSLRGISFASVSARISLVFPKVFLLLPLLFPGVILPDSFSPFANSETNEFLSFAVTNWSTLSELLGLPDSMSGLRSLRPHLKLNSLQTKYVRLCLFGVCEVISVLQSHCPEVNRGDVSALVSAFSEFPSLLATLVDMFILSSYGVPREQKSMILADFSLSSHCSLVLWCFVLFRYLFCLFYWEIRHWWVIGTIWETDYFYAESEPRFWTLFLSWRSEYPRFATRL